MPITINIKSEIDSRALLYPLMRCLLPFGRCLVVSSNKMITRLIDNAFDGEFRNFRIIYDSEGASNEALEEAQIDPSEYNYVIYDNTGAVEQDILLIPIGPYISDDFETEMMYLGEDKNTHIIRFGTAVKKDRGPTVQKKKPNELTIEEQEEAVKSRFRPKKQDVAVKLKKLPNIKFPSFEEIENFEGQKKFFQVDRNIVKFFYVIFGVYFGISEPNFIREVTKRDEGSTDLGRKPANGENSIELNVGKPVP